MKNFIIIIIIISYKTKQPFRFFLCVLYDLIYFQNEKKTKTFYFLFFLATSLSERITKTGKGLFLFQQTKKNMYETTKNKSYKY